MKLLTQKQKRDYIKEVIDKRHKLAFQVDTNRLMYPVTAYMNMIRPNKTMESIILKFECKEQVKKFKDFVRKTEICAMSILNAIGWESTKGIGYPCEYVAYNFSNRWMI